MDKSGGLTVHMEPARVTRWFVLAVLVLALGHSAAMVCKFFFGHSYARGMVPFLDMDREYNLPTIYSCFSLAVCGILLFLLAYGERQAGRRDSRYWGVLAALFFLLAADEGFLFHEKVSVVVQAALDTRGFLLYAWVLPYGAFLLLLASSYCRFLCRLPCGVRNLILLAGVLYAAGALGLESMTGYYFDAHGERDLGYTVIATAEELLEMSGVVVFIYALLRHMTTVGLQLRFDSRAAADPSEPFRADEITRRAA